MYAYVDEHKIYTRIRYMLLCINVLKGWKKCVKSIKKKETNPEVLDHK